MHVLIFIPFKDLRILQSWYPKLYNTNNYSIETLNHQILFIFVISGEAKNLPGRNPGGPGGHRDVFCALTLDQEEIFRTTTIERTLK